MILHYKNREVHIFSNADQIADFTVERWAEASKKAIEKNGHFTFALSGGRTPIVFYKKLADSKKSLPWDKTHIFMVDERFVPLEHDESNYRMINRTLIKNINIPVENIHPIATIENIPENSALKYEEDLISFFKLKPGEFPRFDLIFLGIGEDGHTASLFPGASSLKETDHLAIAVAPPVISKIKRITLTFPVINNAELIIFLISGDNKANIVKGVVEDDLSDLPASMVNSEKGRVLFFIDENAGSLLSKPVKK